MTEIISRDEALARGLKRYFTGKPCRAGHVAERYSGNGGCTECHRAYRADHARRWRKANPEKARDAANRLRIIYPEKFRAYRREYMRDYMRRRRAAEKAAQQAEAHGA